MVELPVTMRQRHDELARVLVAGNAYHDAVDRALPLDLEPVALPAGHVPPVGARGDHALHRGERHGTSALCQEHSRVTRRVATPNDHDRSAGCGHWAGPRRGYTQGKANVGWLT